MSQPKQPKKPTTAQVAQKMAKMQMRADAKRNRKLAKQFGNQLIAKAGGSENLYLRTLLNPEQYQTSYPDEFGDKTAVCTFVVNKQLKWDDSGNYFAWVSPTLKSNLVAREVSTASTNHYTSYTPFAKGHAVKGGPAQTLPLNAPGTHGTPNVHLTVTDNIIQLPKMTANGNIFCKWESANAPSIEVGMLIDGVTYTAFTNDIGTGLVIPSTAKNVAIQASVSGATAYTLSAVTVNMILTQASDGVSTLVNTDVPSYSDLIGGGPGDSMTPICEEYRTVAQSILVTYEGDTLYNGGTITARVVDGGDNPMQLGLDTYASIASLPDSYERPLTMGAYAFWKPTDEKDMYFRDAKVDNTDGDLPSFVVAGTVKNVANAVIRIRICTVVEIKTFKPFMSTTYSIVDPAQISAAAVALRGIPRIMENPLHLEDIKKFLKGLVERGQQVYEAGKTIAPLAIPLAKAVGSFLL